MKHLLMILLILTGCGSNIKNHEGYIFDYNTGRPLSNVEVCSNHDKIGQKCVKTDNKGFFKTEDINLSQYLFIYINGRLSDSVQTVFTNGGEKHNEYFVNGRKDTVFIDMKNKKIVRQ
ncbi:hypothetical protein AB9T88_01495 [Flavobacterium sp. LBUM151]